LQSWIAERRSQYGAVGRQHRAGGRQQEQANWKRKEKHREQAAGHNRGLACVKHEEGSVGAVGRGSIKQARNNMKRRKTAWGWREAMWSRRVDNMVKRKAAWGCREAISSRRVDSMENGRKPGDAIGNMEQEGG
jgi:hypothetical protein